MSTAPVLAVVFKAMTLFLGGLITAMAFKAYRRTGARPLRSLSIGFLLVTIGALLAGIADVVVGVPTHQAMIIESSVTAIGFVVITYSLYQGS
ncbi:MAG: hypothetical protein R3324_21920 [Halobacteriales archaeon]|nr:hypothetical protein [Halobacteriales archaeon]